MPQTEIPSVGEERLELSHITGTSGKWYVHCLAISKLNICVLTAPAILLPGLCPKEVCAYVRPSKHVQECLFQYYSL